jgi:hypothetical protein
MGGTHNWIFMKKIKFIDENLIGQNNLSRYINYETGWSRDCNDYDIAIYTDRLCFLDNIDSTKENYAWIIEPPIVNGDNYIKITKPEFFNKFKLVFSYNKWLDERIPNFQFVPHGGTWLREQDIDIYLKNKMCSMIFSDKQWNAGHRLRSVVYENLKNKSFIDFFGSGVNNPIEFKVDALKDYMFSITMENEGPQHLFSPDTDYFSEKLLDCFLTGTIPIYYGNKSIINYFDINGIILFEDSSSIDSIINNLSKELYLSKIQSIKNNFAIAHTYMHPEKIINIYAQ